MTINRAERKVSTLNLDQHQEMINNGYDNRVIDLWIPVNVHKKRTVISEREILTLSVVMVNDDGEIFTITRIHFS